MPSQTMTTQRMSSTAGSYVPLNNLSLTSLSSTKKDYPISISETSTLAPSTYPFSPQSTSTFSPTSSVQIQTAGKNCISLPAPTKELTTPVFSISPETNSTDRPLYLSIRPVRKSGSCHVVLADDETQSAVARTEYKFGPGRPPVVRLGADDDIAAEQFEILNKGMWTRAQEFESKRYGKFVWRYGSKSERAQRGANNLLILEKVVGKSAKTNVRVAQLVRSDDTRTPGTGKNCAGNGGRLEMDLGEKEELISELAVVVTCLVMLKKEIDRLRGTQIAVISSAAS